MSKTLQKGFIEKKEKGSGEYQELYLEGIELLQKLSGANWTDYNEHDPGVTIFENIAYTLTNLSYKVDLPINDILTTSKGRNLDSGDNGFFIPSDILTTNPVIEDDYRKLFIDGIRNVKNVWIKIHQEQPKKTNEFEANNIKGLYHVSVEMYDYAHNSRAQKIEENRIINRVKEIFHAHRNLCENIYQVVILKPFYLDMTLKLSLNEDVDGEVAFSKIYYHINNYLSHDVNYESLWELREQEIDTNIIYEGPILGNGYIKDSELQSIKNKILISEITKIISTVSGVLSIDEFEIFQENRSDKPFTFEINVPKNRSPRLRIPSTNKDKMLAFKTANVKLIPDVREIKKKLMTIQAQHYGSFKAASDATNIDDIAKGESLDISSYYSIRKQFPAIYGIGDFGLPKVSSDLRKAQVKQLKAYLLPFDQLMSNFLSQLTNIYTIYDVNESGLQSYFYQELEDMQDLVALIKSNSCDEDVALSRWKKTLKKLNSTFDIDAIQRLNEVADSLLARYAEQFPSYVLQKINTICYGKNFTDQQYDKKLLSWKRKLISNYGHLSYNRAKSFDITLYKWLEKSSSKLWGTPIIVQKMASLLGIQLPELRTLSSIVNDSEFNAQHLINERSQDYTKNQIRDLERLVKTLRETIVMVGSKKDKLNETLKLGVISTNYEIKRIGRVHKVHALFLNLNGKRHKLFTSKLGEVHLNKVKQWAIDFLKKLNESSEGMHCVEHLLLAPPVEKAHFGFSFCMPLTSGEEIRFKQVKLMSNDDRNKCVNIIREQRFKYKRIRVRSIYYIEIYQVRNKTLARSNKSFKSFDEVVICIKALNDSQLKLETKNLHKLSYYAYYNCNKINESFFSFKMSFILPSWPVRFQCDSFKRQFHNVLYEQAPMHIQYHLYWINLMKMDRFESHYFVWLIQLANEEFGNTRMHDTYQLIQDIKQFQCDIVKPQTDNP